MPNASLITMARELGMGRLHRCVHAPRLQALPVSGHGSMQHVGACQAAGARANISQQVEDARAVYAARMHAVQQTLARRLPKLLPSTGMHALHASHGAHACSVHARARAGHQPPHASGLGVL